MIEDGEVVAVMGVKEGDGERKEAVLLRVSGGGGGLW